jgi:hypothetical protein
MWWKILSFLPSSLPDVLWDITHTITNKQTRMLTTFRRVPMRNFISLEKSSEKWPFENWKTGVPFPTVSIGPFFCSPLFRIGYRPHSKILTGYRNLIRIEAADAWSMPFTIIYFNVPFTPPSRAVLAQNTSTPPLKPCLSCWSPWQSTSRQLAGILPVRHAYGGRATCRCQACCCIQEAFNQRQNFHF